MIQIQYDVIKPNIINGHFNKLFYRFISFKYGDVALIRLFEDKEFSNFFEKYSEKFDDSIFPVFINRFNEIFKIEIKEILKQFNNYIHSLNAY